jgi:hypothetical protein
MLICHLCLAPVTATECVIHLSQPNHMITVAAQGTVRILGEVNPQLAVVKWIHSMPSQGGPPLPTAMLPDIQIINHTFSAHRNIVDHRLWPSKYAMNIKEAQLFYYTKGARIVQSPVRCSVCD